MKLKLIKKIKEANNTLTFVWEPEKEVKYLPGQYYYYTLSKLDMPDPRGATRHLTISSSPTEKGYISFTTRMRKESGFKQTVSSLPVGSVIEGEGPNGTFVFDEKTDSKNPNIFVAGGIGITPFRSIIKYLTDIKSGAKIYLIYSDSTPQDMTFEKELKELMRINQNFKIKFVFTKQEGRLNKTKIDAITKSWEINPLKATWWLCGPPLMVDALEDIFRELHIPQANVRSEKFTGY